MNEEQLDSKIEEALKPEETGLFRRNGAKVGYEYSKEIIDGVEQEDKPTHFPYGKLVIGALILIVVTLFSLAIYKIVSKPKAPVQVKNEAYSVIQATDGRVYVAKISESTDGFITFNDFYVPETVASSTKWSKVSGKTTLSRNFAVFIQELTNDNPVVRAIASSTEAGLK